MKGNALFTAFIIFLFSFGIAGYSQNNGYRLKIKIHNLKDNQIILGHHFANNLLPDDTAKINSNGLAEFSGKEKLKPGMYFIFLPNKSYFDILIGDKQIFSFENDTFDFVNRFKSEGSPDNELFYNYQRYFVEKNKQAKEISDKLKSAATEPEKKESRELLLKIDKEVKDHINNDIQQNPDLFFSTFLKATVDVQVPDFPRDDKGKVKDSLFQYRYYRAHYFDNFDFTNSGLLRTPIYEGKFKPYFEKIIPQIPDSIISEVDMLITKARKDPDVFRYVLVTLFNNYASSQIMGMDKVFYYIAEKYYVPDAIWSSKDFIDKLKVQIKEKKPLLIGNIAPDIQLVDVPAEHFAQAADDTAARRNPYVGSFFNLSDVKAKYTILFFWDTDCGHCQKAMPVLHDVYERLKDKGVKVVAVHILGGVEGKEKWVKYINEHNYLDWVNAWNPYDFAYKDKYDVKTTPVLFLLDEKKKIIAKQISPEQTEDILKYLLKSNAKP
jgi:thiol-disulfide isomerase/thioredoxin